jgi:hypothetical protein
MLIVIPAFLHRALAAKANAAGLRVFFSRIPGTRAIYRDAIIGTFGAAMGALSVARHIAHL